VSLRLLEAELRGCSPRRACSADTLQFYGLNYIQGYGIDPVRHDIVLYGQAIPGAPPLRIEDFAVALRNVTHRYDRRQGHTLYYAYPMVSLDPDPRVLRSLDRVMDNGGRPWERARLDTALRAWCGDCQTPQTVRIEGVPFDSRFSKIMFVADYLMKRIADGTVAVEGVESRTDIAIAEDKGRKGQGGKDDSPSASLSRFWFYPGENDYGFTPRGVVLQRSDILVLTEAEKVDRDARIAASGRRDPGAEAFACGFSQRYEQIAASLKIPVYTELQGLFRWVSLTRILVGRQAFQQAGYSPVYLLDGFTLTPVAVPRTAMGIASVKTWDDPAGAGVRLASCGGVSMEIDFDRLRTRPEWAKRVADILERVFSSRKDPNAVWWPVIACGDLESSGQGRCKSHA
jgi:hypothetical protein